MIIIKNVDTQEKEKNQKGIKGDLFPFSQGKIMKVFMIFLVYSGRQSFTSGTLELEKC